MCNVPDNIMDCVAASKPDGYKLVQELKEMGFDLPLGIFMRILDGNYTGITITPTRDELVFKTNGYDPITIYKHA